MDFFDCNAGYGVNIAEPGLRPLPNLRELEHELDRAGIRRAMVYRVEQHTAGPALGNDLLARDIAGNDRFYGIWALTPPHTHEVPDPADMADRMRDNRIFGWRLCPGPMRFLLRPFVLKPWLELGLACHIPFFINVAQGVSYEALAHLLESYPDLTVILTDPNVWPNDRMLRPFAAEFRNVYLDLSYCTVQDGLESFVAEYGTGRLLYGSGLPGCYPGANMLMIRHAGLTVWEKDAIAGGNMEQIMGRVAL